MNSFIRYSLIFALPLFSLLSDPNSFASEHSSGIFVKIYITDGCEGTDVQCRKRPFIGDVRVFRDVIAPVAHKETDASGEARFTLQPGKYRIDPSYHSGGLTLSHNADVEVYPNRFSSVTLFLH